MRPVDRETMNYTSAAVGVISVVSLITWIATGRKRFTGPRILGEGREGEKGGDGG